MRMQMNKRGSHQIEIQCNASICWPKRTQLRGFETLWGGWNLRVASKIETMWDIYGLWILGALHQPDFNLALLHFTSTCCWQLDHALCLRSQLATEEIGGPFFGRQTKCHVNSVKLRKNSTNTPQISVNLCQLGISTLLTRANQNSVPTWETP